MSKNKIEKYNIECGSNSWLAQPGLIFYVEKEYHPDTNESVLLNLEELEELASAVELKFVYLPEFLSSCGEYLYKYMTGRKLVSSDLFLRHHSLESVVGTDVFNQIQGPSLLFTGISENHVCEVYNLQLVEKIVRLKRNHKETHYQIDKKGLYEIFEDYIHNHRQDIFSVNACINEEDETKDENEENLSNVNISRSDENDLFFKMNEDLFSNYFCPACECHIDTKSASNKSKEESIPSSFGKIPLSKEENIIVEKVLDLVERLQIKGYSTEAIFALFTPEQKISSLLITEDYRIILPEYNDMEIPLPAVQKAVYFLFLRHPEGINFKDMSDYRDELFKIYSKLAQRGTVDKLAATVDDLVNPLSNAMNEKCSRIKNIFRYLLIDTLAKNYYINGEKGECKRIAIDSSLIKWMKNIL